MRTHTLHQQIHHDLPCVPNKESRLCNCLSNQFFSPHYVNTSPQSCRGREVPPLPVTHSYMCVSSRYRPESSIPLLLPLLLSSCSSSPLLLFVSSKCQAGVNDSHTQKQSSLWQPGLDHNVDNASPWKCSAVWFLSFLQCSVYFFTVRKQSKEPETEVVKQLQSTKRNRKGGKYSRCEFARTGAAEKQIYEEKRGRWGEEKGGRWKCGERVEECEKSRCWG